MYVKGKATVHMATKTEQTVDNEIIEFSIIGVRVILQKNFGKISANYKEACECTLDLRFKVLYTCV